MVEREQTGVSRGSNREKGSPTISIRLFVGLWFNFACGANYPHQALKGSYFAFVWRVGT